jgi:DNA adenine methylase
MKKRENKLNNGIAKPFLKWAGGKTQLLSQFEKYYPPDLREGKIKRYIEPFVGSGAVFFNIIQKYDVELAYLYDINEELILTYKVIQKDPNTLMEFLEKYSRQYKRLDEEERKEYFYQVRDSYNGQRLQINYKKFAENWIPRAAQMIFLNKTCYNGLFRLNKMGEFNVPFGRYKNPKILDEENLLKVSSALNKAEISAGSFESCEAEVSENSFVYFDPPYRPLNRTSNFTAYSKKDFGELDQHKLGDFFRKLDETHRSKLMLSNSDPDNESSEDDFFNNIYRGYHIHKVSASRMINSNAKKRGAISELVITNYENK